MKGRFLACVAVAGAVLAVAVPSRRSEAAPSNQIVQQGRLVDSNGVPLEGVVGQLTFRIYSSPNPDPANILWSESHQGVRCSRGVYTLNLGSQTPFGTVFDAGTPRYLEIQVDSDPPLSPLSQIGAVPLALSAPGTVPIGTVIDWWRPGPNTPIPAGWAVCDGSPITDPLSDLVGELTPPLVGRFVRGLDPALVTPSSYGIGATTSLPDIGGNPAVDLTHSHTIDPDGSHRHTVPAQTVSTTFETLGDATRTPPAPAYYGGPYGDHKHDVEIPAIDTDARGNHDHGGATGSAALGNVEVLPPYVGMLKLMRVR